MIIEKLIPAILISICVFLIYLGIKKRKKDLEIRQDMPDDAPLQDVVMMRDFNGHKIYLAESELDAWKSLSNSQKQRIHLKQLYCIKNGLLIKVTDENGNEGLITKAEAVARRIIK